MKQTTRVFLLAHGVLAISGMALALTFTAGEPAQPPFSSQTSHPMERIGPLQAQPIHASQPEVMRAAPLEGELRAETRRWVF